jgi:hypothetical protein
MMKNHLFNAHTIYDYSCYIEFSTKEPLMAFKPTYLKRGKYRIFSSNLDKY